MSAPRWSVFPVVVLCAASVTAGRGSHLASAAGTAPFPIRPTPDTLAARRAVMAFIQAIDRLDLDGVADSFSRDGTAFYPFSFTPHRLDGREQIREAQRQGFDWARAQLVEAGHNAPLSLNLQPTHMEVRLLGETVAIVTWHSDRSTHAGRRTAVLHRIQGEWLIVHHHASNMPRSN